MLIYASSYFYSHSIALSTMLCCNSAHCEVTESGMGCVHRSWLTHVSRFLVAPTAYIIILYVHMLAAVDSFSLAKKTSAVSCSEGMSSCCCCWKWNFLHFTRYSCDTFHVWWTGSWTLMWNFFRILYTKHYSYRFIFWRSYSKNKKMATFGKQCKSIRPTGTASVNSRCRILQRVDIHHAADANVEKKLPLTSTFDILTSGSVHAGVLPWAIIGLPSFMSIAPAIFTAWRGYAMDLCLSVCLCVSVCQKL